MTDAIRADVEAMQLQTCTTVDPQGGLAFETDTICTPDISFPEWLSGVTGGSTISTLRAQGTIDTLLDAVWLNAQQDVSGDVAKSFPFSPPPGTTSMVFTVPMKLASGSAKNVTLSIYNSSAVLVSGASAVYSITTTTSRPSLTVTGLIPGLLYYATIRCNVASEQANPLVGRVQLLPVGATGLFAKSFRRLRISASMVAGNILTGWNSGIYPYLSPNADIIFNTNANVCVTESFGSSTGSGAMSALYGGQPLYNGGLVPNGGFLYDTVTLPYADESTNVTIRTGTGLGAIGNVLGKYTGSFIRSIYVPSANAITFLPFNTRDLCIGVGDSIILGNSSGDLPFQSWSAHFRQQYAGNFAIDAHNSRTLFDYGSDATKQEAFAKFIGKCQPKHVIWCLGVNDFVTHPWTGGTGVNGGCLTFANAQANIIDLIRDKYSPSTFHFILTPTRLTDETEKGNGTLPNFRTNLTNIGTGRTNYVQVIDGTSLMAAGDIDVDGIHMTTIGQAKVGSGMIAALAARVPPEV